MTDIEKMQEFQTLDCKIKAYEKENWDPVWDTYILLVVNYDEEKFMIMITDEEISGNMNTDLYPSEKGPVKLYMDYDEITKDNCWLAFDSGERESAHSAYNKFETYLNSYVGWCGLKNCEDLAQLFMNLHRTKLINLDKEEIELDESAI